MKPASLANISYDEALGLLQLRKEALAAGEAPRLPTEKLASSYILRDFGNAVMDDLEKQAIDQVEAPAAPMNPILKNTLLAGGLGALGGLGKSMFSDDEDEKDQWWRNALMGGVGGAALGGGLTTLLNSDARNKLMSSMGADETVEPTQEVTPEEEVAARGKEVVDQRDFTALADEMQGATSTAPDWKAGITAAGTGAGGLYGVHKALSSQSPMHLAQNIVDQPNAAAKSSQFRRLFKEYSGASRMPTEQATVKLLNALKNDPREFDKFSKFMRGKGMGVNWLGQHPNPGAMKNLFSDLDDLPRKNMLETPSSRSLRNLVPSIPGTGGRTIRSALSNLRYAKGKAGRLAAVLGGVGLGGKALWDNWVTPSYDYRDRARAVMRNIADNPDTPKAFPGVDVRSAVPSDWGKGNQ